MSMTQQGTKPQQPPVAPTQPKPLLPLPAELFRRVSGGGTETQSPNGTW